MARDTNKYFFAAIPGRAAADGRLSALHFRVLMAVAAHDRMNRNGQGCWAGNATLASMVNCHPKRLSVAMTELVAMGYLSAHKSDEDARRKGYRVVYEVNADAHAMGANRLRDGNLVRAGDRLLVGNLNASPDRLRDGNLYSPDRLRNRDQFSSAAPNFDNLSRDLGDQDPSLIYSVETEDITRSVSGDGKTAGKLRAKLVERLGSDGWQILTHLDADTLRWLERLERDGALTNQHLADARRAAAAAAEGKRR